MKFLAIRGKLVVDNEGEAKITFIVSKLEVEKILNIPTETLLSIDVVEDNNEVIGDPDAI